MSCQTNSVSVCHSGVLYKVCGCNYSFIFLSVSRVRLKLCRHAGGPGDGSYILNGGRGDVYMKELMWTFNIDYVTLNNSRKHA